jgi:hypothetical protein
MAASTTPKPNAALRHYQEGLAALDRAKLVTTDTVALASLASAHFTAASTALALGDEANELEKDWINDPTTAPVLPSWVRNTTGEQT